MEKADYQFLKTIRSVRIKSYEEFVQFVYEFLLDSMLDWVSWKFVL